MEDGEVTVVKMVEEMAVEMLAMVVLLPAVV